MTQIVVIVLYFAYFRIVTDRKHRAAISTPSHSENNGGA